MAEDRSRHLRALADFLGKEFYAVDYDAGSGLFRLLAPPNTGLEPLSGYRVYTAEEESSRGDQAPNEAGVPHETWHYLGTDYHIYGPLTTAARA